jgi:hypothetical protein
MTRAEKRRARSRKYQRKMIAEHVAYVTDWKRRRGQHGKRWKILTWRVEA